MLPASRSDDCINAASLFFNSVRWDGESPYFQPELGDFQTSRSHELGVGMGMLLVHDTLGIPWDELEQIPGQKRRMDYRGEKGGLKLVLEAKGTCRRSQQTQHVQSGIAKKAAHKSRGDQFTLGITCSTTPTDLTSTSGSTGSTLPRRSSGFPPSPTCSGWWSVSVVASPSRSR